ncbi:MAG: molecular chaperone HscB [Candidatus Endobugula sp.]|jgi:molecular chaperone HscB
MNFTQNYFDLLNVPLHFYVDKNRLSTHYRDLQKQFHPDKSASKPASEQRMAVQFSGYINTAYETLRSPVYRAEYMLSCEGEAIDVQSVTISDGQFLFLQMEWRELLGDILALDDHGQAENKLEELHQTVKQTFGTLESSFDQQYTQRCFVDAKVTVAKMQFVEKMLKEIDAAESTLFD